MATPNEIAALTHLQYRIVQNVPAGTDTIILGSRAGRVGIWLHVTGGVGNNFVCPGPMPTVVPIAMQIPSSGLLLSFHDFGGLMGAEWHISLANISNLFVLEWWIE